MSSPSEVEEPRVLMAPMNLAMMPVLLVEELQRRGYKANHIQLSYGGPHRFGFRMDREINLHDRGGRIRGMANVLEEVLEDDYNIFHYWNKSLFYKGDYTQLSGFDIPLIKARGRRLCYRFSGFDIRLPSWDKAVNPHSPFNYGYAYPYDEGLVKAYHGLLHEYVDQFIVQDPELGQFMPGARIVPRGLELDVWKYVGPVNKTRPMVVHAPSNSIVKGTPFVLKAVEDLRAEGLDFDFQLVQDTTLEEARAIYEGADIIVDQLCIGATGVLTLEGWALGKCVVTNLRPELFNDFYQTDDLPRVNATPDDITDQLRVAIRDATLRTTLGERGRELVERFHPISTVTDTLLDVYRDVLAAPPTQPTGYGDLKYLRVQAQLVQSAEGAAVREQKLRLKAQAKTKPAKAPKPAATADLDPDRNRIQRAAATVWTSSPAALYTQAQESAANLWERSTRNPLVTAKFAQAASDLTVVDPVDLVVSHDIWALLAADKIRRRDNCVVAADMVEIPILEHRSGAALREIPRPIRSQIDRLAKTQLRQADMITTVSPALVDYIQNYVDRPVSLLRNFREDEAIETNPQLRNDLGLRDEHRIIAFVNTLAPNYGVEATIRALKLLDERYHLVTIGRFVSTGYKNRLRRLVSRLKLGGRVHMLDPIPPLRFVRYLSGADVGIIASAGGSLNLQMAFPNRVTDYLSAGIPVVAHGMRAADDFVRETGVGVVTASLEPEALAEAFRELTREDQSQRLRKAVESTRSSHNWSTESRDFIDFCDHAARIKMKERDGDIPHSVVIARKTIARNGRVYRMCKSLSEAGHYVRVVAYDNFDAEYSGLPNVSVLPVGKDVLR